VIGVLEAELESGRETFQIFSDRVTFDSDQRRCLKIERCLIDVTGSRPPIEGLVPAISAHLWSLQPKSLHQKMPRHHDGWKRCRSSSRRSNDY